MKRRTRQTVMVAAPPPILRGRLKISGLKFWGSPEIFSKFRGDLKLRGDLKFKGGPGIFS